MNPKHILLPTDLSEVSLRPLEHARIDAARVVLLSVPLHLDSSCFVAGTECAGTAL